MRMTCLIAVIYCALLGCSEGISNAEVEVEAVSSDSIPPDVQEASMVSTPSRFAANPTAELVEFYLHFYDRNQQEQEQYYDLHDQVEQELIARGAQTVSELMKYDYSLNKYPYSYQSSELIRAIGPEASQAIPVLVDCVVRGTKQETGSWYPKECLIAIGSASIPELIKHFNGEDLHVAWAVSVPLD